ncbi:MAG: UbiD family decarboxylase [Fibrobacterales bacterium]
MYLKTADVIKDLEKRGELLRISHEVDPHLEMAAIQRRVYANGGPAILFEKVKGSPFQAVSNLYGTEERVGYIFRETEQRTKEMIDLKVNPSAALSHPFKSLLLARHGLHALPKKVSHSQAPVLWGTTDISELPGLVSWPEDGGRYITLPLVYSEDPDQPGPMNSNLGMYRVQLDGGEYDENKEIGLHYQLHRGIAVHHKAAIKKGEDLKVSIFVGGPPAHTVAAVMPLPEGVPEVTFGGLLAGRRFRYTIKNGHTISADADFCIVGTIPHGAVKPEGPFGDHLGYYSLVHEMPVMKVEAVYHRKNAVWPFTVVGRPPQEDTQFGAFIHKLTQSAIPAEIPGVKEVHAVDEAGVHPLLLAIGTERYVPYMEQKRPQELLTLSNLILGTGQLSLAKYLFIIAEEDDPSLSTHSVGLFFKHLLARVDWRRDLHFQTETTIDTLDYTGSGLNKGSKVVVAAAGTPIRSLWSHIPEGMTLPFGFKNPEMIFSGVMAIEGPEFKDSDNSFRDIHQLTEVLTREENLEGIPLIVVVDDAHFIAKSIENFLWVTFTRSNPSHDIHGVKSFVENKHWGCKGSLIIDARVKPHHAPPLIEDLRVTNNVDQLMKELPL